MLKRSLLPGIDNISVQLMTVNTTPDNIGRLNESILNTVMRTTLILTVTGDSETKIWFRLTLQNISSDLV